MTDLPEVGPWAKIKLEALARYLDFYTTVLKNQHWQTIYFDAYAGGGRAVIRGDGRSLAGSPSLFDEVEPEIRELVDGSPRVALACANPFDRYVFVDPDPRRAAELNELRAEFGASQVITVRQETASQGVAWIVSQDISRRSHRGVAFLDPFGAALEWASIQALADTGLFEVVVNFALSMAIQRMLPNSGNVPDSWAATLDRFFGNRAWFEEVYQRRDDGLFDEGGYEKRQNYSERLLELYRARLKAVFGFVSAPRLIRNTRGAPLYFLLWAGPNKKGLEGANYILKMGERMGRGSNNRHH